MNINNGVSYFSFHSESGILEKKTMTLRGRRSHQDEVKDLCKEKTKEAFAAAKKHIAQGGTIQAVNAQTGQSIAIPAALQSRLHKLPRGLSAKIADQLPQQARSRLTSTNKIIQQATEILPPAHIQGKTAVGALPDEVLSEIAKHTSPEGLLNLGATNKTIRRALRGDPVIQVRMEHYKEDKNHIKHLKERIDPIVSSAAKFARGQGDMLSFLRVSLPMVLRQALSGLPKDEERFLHIVISLIKQMPPGPARDLIGEVIDRYMRYDSMGSFTLLPKTRFTQVLENLPRE